MSKLLSQVFLSILVLFPNTAYASDIVLKLDLEETRKASIHKDLVTKTGLHKKKHDNYHVTLAVIQNVDPIDGSALKSYLKNQLKKQYSKFVISKGSKAGQLAIPVGLKKADRYLVGRRTQDKCPIVFYFTPHDQAMLKDANVFLLQALQNFNSPSGKKYTQFENDLQPQNYIPHITIANTAYISGEKADRDAVISSLNSNLANAEKALPNQQYRFKLRLR